MSRHCRLSEYVKTSFKKTISYCFHHFNVNYNKMTHSYLISQIITINHNVKVFCFVHWRIVRPNQKSLGRNHWPMLIQHSTENIGNYSREEGFLLYYGKKDYCFTMMTNKMYKHKNGYFNLFIKRCSHSNWNVHSWEEFVYNGCSFVNQKLQVSNTSAI